MMGKPKQRVKTPVVLQMEATECGAAALGSILAYYGLFLPLETLRIECGVSRDGSKAVNVLRAARRLGMVGSGFRYSPEQIREQPLPAIIHWNFNHFLVLEGFKGDTVYLNDPAAGHRTVDWEEFEGCYTGIALMLSPGPDFRKAGAPRSSLQAILQRFRDHKVTLGFVLIAGLGLVVPGLALPVMQQVFFDDILSRQHDEWLFNLMLAMGVVAILQASLTYLRAWCLTRWQGSMTIGGSSKFMWHLFHLPMEFFQQRYVGELASRAQFNESVAQVLTGQAAAAVLDVAVALCYLLLLFQYNPALTLIGCTFSLINVLILQSMFRWLKDQQMKIQQEAGKVYGVSIAGIQTIETLKANGNEADFFTKWAGYQSKILDAMQRVELTQQLFMLAPVLLGGLNTAMIMAIGGFEIMDGLMTVGIFMAFQSLMGKFQEPVNKLLSLVETLQTTETQMHRLDDVMRYPRDSSIDSGNTPCEAGLDKLTGQVELREISFGYSRLEPPLIEKFSLHIEPGRRVALVGGSGSGKSTVAKLVTGLYQPWEGEILYDGKKRSDLPREVLVHSLAGVDQDIVLFSGTVAENISLFDPTLPRFDIVRAARDAAIHDDIAALQGSYDAAVEEGGRNFSGGQRQRLEIARALATNPSLLVLDEATSALDPLTERLVTDNISRRGCACLVIAHRLSTIRDCDEIIVLQQGKVVQRGTHEEMMAAGGPYKQLLDPDLDHRTHGREEGEKA